MAGTESPERQAQIAAQAQTERCGAVVRSVYAIVLRALELKKSHRCLQASVNEPAKY
jgi:hypothetical protein